MKKQRMARANNNKQISLPKFTEAQMISIQEEAYYRAMRRIEEDRKRNEKKNNAERRIKYNRRDIIGVFVNMLIFPFYIKRKDMINKKLYDGIISICVSSSISSFGFVTWMFGILGGGAIIYKKEFSLINFFIMVVSLLFGSFCYISGKQLKKIEDSNMLYSFSASFFAMISCIASIVAILTAQGH